MDRVAQLEYCKTCIRREFSPKKGIVCSLTKEQATFAVFCDDFQEDKIESQLLEDKRNRQHNEEVYEDSLGLSKIGIKDGVAAGVIVITLAILWFGIGLLFLNRIFFYPPFLLALGIYTLLKGIKKRKKNRLSDSEILS